VRTNTAGPDWDVFLAYAGPDRARALASRENLKAAKAKRGKSDDAVDG
jgi:hypothetical protein